MELLTYLGCEYGDRKQEFCSVYINEWVYLGMIEVCGVGEMQGSVIQWLKLSDMETPPAKISSLA